MQTLLFRCPHTGLTVQGWLPETEAPGVDSHEMIPCTACGGFHAVSRSTGAPMRRDAEPRERRDP